MSDGRAPKSGGASCAWVGPGGGETDGRAAWQGMRWETRLGAFGPQGGRGAAFGSRRCRPPLRRAESRLPALRDVGRKEPRASPVRRAVKPFSGFSLRQLQIFLF